MLHHWVSEGKLYIHRWFCIAQINEAVYVCMLHGLYLNCIRRNITLGGY